MRSQGSLRLLRRLGARSSWIGSSQCAVALLLAACNAFDSPPREVALSPSPNTAQAPVPTSVAVSACVPFLDADGDGALVNAAVRCPGVALQAESATDCDDSDPERQAWATFYADADSDGVGVVEGSILACAGKLIPGYVERVVVSSEDCNDADASVQVMGSRDLDGDGQGAGPPECVALDAEGYSLNTPFVDCADNAPDVYEGQLETAFDELDSNCDGLDYPSTTTNRTYLDTLAFAVPPVARCAGRGLGIIGQAVWSGQAQGAYPPGGAIFVGNRGTLIVSGATLQTRNVETGTIETATIPPLGPNGVARIDYSNSPSGAHWLALYVPERDSAANGSTLGDGDAGIGASMRSDAGSTQLDTERGDAASAPLPACTPLSQNGILIIPDPPRVRRVP